ncbi:hypothetical protein FRB91_011293 [Serendipita sp. 411]|nr:hypothetical protein FRB91_011293 [Serendipita sp. 411]KAG9053042.1 hypothetical protein FS842_008764 [Serendipita sp. 407]
MPVWSSASHKKGPELNLELPKELWGIIIDLIVIPLRHPYLYCEPETFPQYQTVLWNVDTSNKIPLLEDWKRVRVVCKEWKQLAGVKPCVFLKEIGPNIHEATSSVFIHGMGSPGLSMERIAHLRENLTTLALGFNTSADTNATDIVLENPSVFPNLRCLSVGSTRTKRPFWKVIQDEFPNLVSLTIRLNVYGEPGRYVLKKIEILSLLLLDGFQLVCPSLKHLHFYSANSVAAHQFITAHGYLLRSFIVSFPGSIETQEDVWSSTFPNLVTFGCRMGKRSHRAVPPSDHPLRHLRLTSDHDSLRPEQVMDEIDAYGFPGLVSVQIRMNDMRQGTANDLKTQCRERGIRLVEIVDGTTFVEGRTAAVSPPRSMMTYIGTAFLLCTLPCWWPCIDKDSREDD